MLTLAQGHPDVVLIGGRGWTLAGSVEAPLVEQPRGSLGDVQAGRFGPGGAWAYAQRGPGVIQVMPLDDPDATFETPVESPGSLLVGDMDEDGLDDLVFTGIDLLQLWRADGAGGFVLLAEPEDTNPGDFFGFSPATDWAPAAVLVARSDTGIVGLELEGDVLEKAYAIDVGLVWAVRGVQPSSERSEAGRSILVAREGGTLLDPLTGYVGFIDGQDGAWSRRGIELGFFLYTAPQAFDLDADGVLDAVVPISQSGGTLRGVCSLGEEMVPCLEVPLTGEPEAIAVDPDGQVFVATEADGLWVHRLGACQ